VIEIVEGKNWPAHTSVPIFHRLLSKKTMQCRRLESLITAFRTSGMLKPSPHRHCLSILSLRCRKIRSCAIIKPGEPDMKTARDCANN
jgi:hypothetical protein